ncbi:MAG TPA: protein kinase [Kofleriaceae bacterium]|nr:protein kinase [Kofleriaceae bacterium]
MTGGPEHPDRDRDPAPAPDPDPDLVAKIGPFQVSRVLGRGGMGIVFAGKHELTGALAAIKTVSRGSETLLSFVRHEASTLSRIRHPGVVQVVGVGVEAGRPWYAMELLSGRTLSDLIDLGAAALGGPYGPISTDAPTADAAPEGLGLRISQQRLATLPVSLQGKAATLLHALRGAVAKPAAQPAGPGARRADATLPASRTDAARAAPAARPPSAPAGPGPVACDLPRMLPILRGVCDALAFVHGEGVVHRDLKPDNIFIKTGELPVLVDFGLATHVGADGRDVLEHIGGVAGSIGYMAPEQLLGELLDARCDLYALGCILYRLVTGRLPFEGAPWQVMAAHLMDAPAPAGRLVKLPPALDELIFGLLVKDRDQRVGSAEAVDSVLAAIGGARCPWPVPLPEPQPFLYRPPFVGRSEVLGQLAARVRRFGGLTDDPEAANDEAPGGGLVLIAGESGAGKTRLALEAAKLSTEASAATVTCGCVPNGSPFQALRELFQALVEHCLAGGPSEVARMFGAGAAVLALYSAEIAELPGVAALPEPEPLPSAAARARVFRCLWDALHAYTFGRPLLLIVDDIHLADSLTLGFLAYFQEQIDRGARPRTLVLGCYRTEERSPALEALAAHRGTLHLAVERMSELEVGQMVRGMLALADPPAAFVAFLARQSGGNPFFVAEYLRTAVGERVLVRDSRGRWKIADTSVLTEAVCEALPLPRSLRQVVELRLGKLAARTREILDAAAVIGRRFSRPLLGAVVELADDAILEALDEMVAAQVIEPIDGEGYRFVHDKLHELPVAALPPARRRALHARVAEAIEAIEAIHADAAGEHEATIGRHWAEAGHPERAAPRLHAAGDAARRVHSVDTAIELYRAARGQLELVLAGAAGAASAAGAADAAGRDQARELDEKLGDALAFSSQHTPARAAFEQALVDLGGGTAAPGSEAELVIRARLLRKIAKTWESVHTYPEALAGYAALEALLAAAPELAAALEPEWIQLMVGRAWIYYWTNRVDEMNAIIEPLRPVIEARGTALDRYRFYLALVTRDYRRDRYRISAETLAHARECVAAAREASAPSEIAFARFVLGFGLIFARQLDEAEAELEAALQATRKISDAVAETRAIAYLALVHALAGHWGDADATATATLAMARARKMGDYEGMGLALQGRVALARGERTRAGELCRQAIATWNAIPFPFPFRWIGALPLLELGLGPAPSSELAQLARELTAATQHHLPDPLDAELREASAAGERGDPGTVKQHTRRAIELAQQLGYSARP